MEVYQRPENLRFFGIKEEADMEEDVREVLVGSLKTELKMQTKSNSKGSIVLESVFLPMVNLDK